MMTWRNSRNTRILLFFFRAFLFCDILFCKMRSAVFALVVVLFGLVASESRYTWSWEPRKASPWVLQANGPSPKKVFEVKVELKLQNTDQLEPLLMAVSEPTSPKYSQHLTSDELKEKFAPLPASIQIVGKFLKIRGARQVRLRPNGRVMVALMTAEQIQSTFQTRLAYYKYQGRDLQITRALESYSLPSDVAEHVDLVSGMLGFPGVRFKSARSNLNVEATAHVDPEYLYKAYDVNESLAPVAGSSQSVVEFGSAYYLASDLQKFFKTYDPVMEGQDILDTYGTLQNPKTSIEANLDVQYIMGMGNFIDTYIYSQPVNSGIEDAFLEYTNYVLDQQTPALVQSISFGEYGGDYDNRTVQKLNDNFMQMGIEGISILLASGDNGVGCNHDCSSFEFDFPSSPYITMVGATEFDSKTGVETGATLSSGGFSADYIRPSYQESAVNGYFNSGVELPSSSLYYGAGRAYPDMAAAGVDVEIVNNGKDTLVSGTSCSAPIFSGLVGLMNNERMLRGKSSLGFLNPFLYANPDAFTDITVGNNQDCPLLSGCCCDGFDATTGWDPVTGLGSPVYSKLRVAALQLP